MTARLTPHAHQQYDTTRDGYISLQELKYMMEKLEAPQVDPSLTCALRMPLARATVSPHSCRLSAARRTWRSRP